MSENGKLTPNLDQHSTKALNLTVLQRVDQFVEEILITAAHVTFYEFNIDLSQWSRKDVEGSLFVVKRNMQPRFQFIVMNRRNEDNLVENILGDFEYEIQVPYLLYRNAAQEVNGIWFYNPQECKEVANLFSRILNAYAKVPAKLNVPSGKSSEFEELEAVPTMAVMDGPLEPSSATTSDVTDVPSDHLLANFFGTALTLGKTTSGTMIPPPCHPPSVPPALPTTIQIQQAGPPLSASSNVYNPHFLNVHENSRTANLVKPSSFFNPPPSSSYTAVSSSSIPTAPLLDPSGNLQRPYGTPLLQPFPPPTPSSSLTPIPVPTSSIYGPVLSRDQVRSALLMLVQDDLFVDKVHRALLNALNS